VELREGTPVDGIEPGGVRSGGGRFPADLVVIAAAPGREAYAF
jgi:glycine/D-amino acid oxidase-like deaminating enzyme